MRQHSSKWTICETIRAIYWKTDDMEIKLLAQEAMDMAKRMDAKLREYKKSYDKGWWDRR